MSIALTRPMGCDYARSSVPMRCPACRVDHPGDSVVCSECGASLEASCPVCAAVPPPGSRFCHRCGASFEAASADGTVAGAPSAVAERALAYGSGEGERRQLTVMFCDLVDSAVLGERLDPEDLHGILHAYQQACAHVVQRHRGHIAQYAGDGLLVYFGYPSADEGDAERAVQAGLDIVDELERLNVRLEPSSGIRLAVRVGIHSGLVVVGATGGGEQHEKQMVGHTMNLAARLQSLAEPGSVVISAATLRLVRGLFVTHELGARSLKGMAEPVPIHQVRGRTEARSRLEVEAAVGLTPFVGREHEVALLLDRWREVREGRGQVVLLTGEAGMGKSRLLLALRERVSDVAHVWLEAHCLPHHEHSAFHPVVELLERGLGLDRQRAPSERITILARALEAVGLPLDEVVPLFSALLSLPADERYPAAAPNPELQRRRTLEWLIAWLGRTGAKHPTVVVVEDLHWVDPSTEELLGMLLAEVPTLPILLVVTSRPTAAVPWADRPRVTRLALQPLTRRQVAAMIERLVDGSALPEALRRQVAAKTDGVPLFVEELTKAVLESGVAGGNGGAALEEFAIPSTLQDSLTARLDRLGPRKEVAQFAAVLGREFSYALLRAVTPMEGVFVDAALRELVRAELVHQRGVPPDATYRFKHALVQEAAHHSLLRSRRQEAHARVVRVLKDRFPERIVAEPEQAARHCMEAGLLGDAILFYRIAGERAARGSAHVEAVGHLTRALELVPALPDAPERDRHELAIRVALGPPLIAIRGYGNSEVERTFERARMLCETIEDAPFLYEAVWGLANYYQARGELLTALRLAEQLVTIAERANVVPLIAWAHLQLGATLFWRGDLAESLRNLETAIAAHNPAARRPLPGAPDAGVAARAYAAVVLWELGRPDRSAQLSRESVALGRTCGDAFSLALALCFGGTVFQLRREPAVVREWAEECMMLARAQQFPLWYGYARVLLGWTLAHSEESERGIDEIQQGLAGLATTGTEVGASGGLALLADAQRVGGRGVEALGTVDVGLALAEQRGQHTWDGLLLRLRGDLVLQVGRDDAAEEAERCFIRALETSRTHGATMSELIAATHLARLLVEQGRAGEARAVLEPVVARVTEGFGTRDVRDALALLAEL